MVDQKESPEFSQEWAELCTKDLYNALLVVLDLILALSGLPGAVTEKDLEATCG